MISFQLARAGLAASTTNRRKCGRVFIGGDVKLAAENLGAVVEILAAGEFDGRRAGFQVLEKKLVLAGRAFIRGQQQPAIIVVGQLRDQNLFLLAAFAPDQGIFGRIGAERVIEDVQIVDVVALGHVTFLGIASVVETGIIFLPGDLGDAGLRSMVSGSSLPVAVSITCRVLFSEPLAEVP